MLVIVFAVRFALLARVAVRSGALRAPCALFEFAHALVECFDFVKLAALVDVGNACGEDALVVGGEAREERFVPCSIDI